MRTSIAAALAGLWLLLSIGVHAQDWSGIVDGVAQRAADRAAGKAMDKAEEAMDKPKQAPPEESASAHRRDSGTAGRSTVNPGGAAGSGGADNYKAYQNYDFVPGENLVFEDDFHSDTDGEFPAHWKLLSGQGVVNAMQGEPVLALTEGNYAKVAPRLKASSYLSDPFTLEFDFYPKAGGYEKSLVFIKSGEDEATVTVGHDAMFEFAEVQLSAQYPGDEDSFKNKWHHAALVYRAGQMKCYIDQYRVLVVPDTGGLKPQSVAFGGVADNEFPLLIKNVRVANGGGMNVIDKLTRDGRFITHAIHFDVGKANVKPESMGAIRELVAALKSAPSLKIEIGGHTDSDGDAAKNLTLSAARAEAVKKVLVDQGIDAARLTTKGYGATKPIDSNSTFEGKANNRRVELVRL